MVNVLASIRWHGDEGKEEVEQGRVSLQLSSIFVDGVRRCKVGPVERASELTVRVSFAGDKWCDFSLHDAADAASLETKCREIWEGLAHRGKAVIPELGNRATTLAQAGSAQGYETSDVAAAREKQQQDLAREGLRNVTVELEAAENEVEQRICECADGGEQRAAGLKMARAKLDLLKSEFNRVSRAAPLLQLCRRVQLPESFLQHCGVDTVARDASSVAGAALATEELEAAAQSEWCMSYGNSLGSGAETMKPMSAFVDTKVARETSTICTKNKGRKDKTYLLQVAGVMGEITNGVTSCDHPNESHYIRVHPELHYDLQKFRQNNNPSLTFSELVRAALGDPVLGDVRFVPRPANLPDRLLGLCNSSELKPPQSLRQKMRPYQVAGFQWLAALCRRKLGAILADDMGLGKTLQSIALVVFLQQEGLLTNRMGEPNPVLIVVPPGLIRNWKKEFQLWAPDVVVQVYHGRSRDFHSDGELPNVILTSYQTLRLDQDRFVEAEQKTFSLMIIDEAQTIKNHDALVTRAVKRVGQAIQGSCIALSGTPVENKVDELHSLFDFVNPGYLGTLTKFRQQFSEAIEQRVDTQLRSQTLELLRKVTRLFQLRRLKTDQNIKTDLPAKIELEHVVALSKSQRTLYAGVHKEWGDIMQQSRKGKNHAFARRGHIFSMLEKMRCICNHPRCFDMKNYPESCKSLEVPFGPEGSGKSARLMELLDEIFPSGEKVVIFVMRKSAMAVLQELIELRYKADELTALTFSGDLTFQQRADVEKRFANEPNCRVLILTMQSGGVGLNLTSASHVVHYDRCYNPARESQATDRCHRIGQHRVVCIHRLITTGTYEERLDKIMRDKLELSSLAVTATEDWISSYDDQALFELFGLGAEANTAPSQPPATPTKPPPQDTSSAVPRAKRLPEHDDLLLSSAKRPRAAVPRSLQNSRQASAVETRKPGLGAKIPPAGPKPKQDIKPVAAPKAEEKMQGKEIAAVASAHDTPAAAPSDQKVPVGSIKWRVLRDASLETWDSGSLYPKRPKRLATVRAGTIVHAHSNPEMHHGKMRVRVSVHGLTGWLSTKHDTADKEPVANYSSGTAFIGYSSCGREGIILEPC